MHKFLTAACGILVCFLLLGCHAPERVSSVDEYQSADHKAIYNFLEESRQLYNQRKDIDLSRLTEEARVNSKYHEGDSFVSPQKMQKIWPSRIEIIRSHEFRLRSIEVEEMSIDGDTARIQTKRTLVSDRWNTRHEYTFKKILKKRNGEWKLHRSSAEPQSCIDCH